MLSNGGLDREIRIYAGFQAVACSLCAMSFREWFGKPKCGKIFRVCVSGRLSAGVGAN